MMKSRSKQMTLAEMIGDDIDAVEKLAHKINALLVKEKATLLVGVVSLGQCAAWGMQGLPDNMRRQAVEIIRGFLLNYDGESSTTSM